jgi:hypothetical protein
MPIFRRSKNPLLHLVYCSVTIGETANIYVFLLVAEQYTKCSNGFFVPLKMGIMMPEKF